MESVNFEDMRRAMVDSQLRTSGVTEPWVVAAMARIPREDYVPIAHRTTAYMDRSIKLDDGSILNPAVSTALMLQAASVQETDTALLIGKPGGYVADILSTRVHELTTISAQQLGEMQMTGRFSLIIIDGAVNEIPAAVLETAEEGARLVTGLFDGAVTRLATGRVQNGAVSLKSFVDSEIGIIPAFAHKPEFVF